MHFTKLIFAAVGISFAVSTPVPQNNNDVLESCNGVCKSEYDTCANNAATEGIGGDAAQVLWYVTQRILRLVVPLLTAHLVAQPI